MVHVDIKKACRMTGLSRTSIYKLINAGELQRIRVLRRSYVTRASLNKLLEIAD